MAAARTRVRWVALVFVAALLAAAAHPALAQESRGSISGTVRDNSGGALPGVTVSAVQQGTNRTTSAVTSDTGGFSLLFLQPGTYTISAELSGFKKVRRENVEVRVNDRVGVDLSMEIGGIEETVTVLAETPLLETRSGSQGQIIDQRRISLLPLSDGNPFILTRLAPGIAYTGDLKFSRPFDNAGTSNVVADGAPGANEFTLDGSPNMASGGRVAYVPPSDAVQEFKVESATFDAQQGHTAGATVNVAIKSGTNSFRGTGYFFYRDEKLSTNEYFLEKAGKPKSQMDYTRWGATLGGPIRKDKTFFFAVFERLDDAFPEPDVFTVPTAAQRNGDFSALLSQGIVIYDPATAFLNAAGRVERLPFPGNVIPASRLSAIAQNYMKYYPTANQAGDAQGRNNFLSEQTRTDDFYSLTVRGDHQFSQNQRLFVRWNKNDRREARSELDGRGQRRQPDGQLSLPQERPGHHRPRVDDVVGHAPEPARRLRGVPRAEHPPAPGRVRPGHARVGAERRAVFPGIAVHAAVRGRRDERARAGPGRKHRARDLVVPADVDQGDRGAQHSARAGTSASTRSSASPRSTAPAATTSTPPTRGSSTTRPLPPSASSWPR